MLIGEIGEIKVSRQEDDFSLVRTSGRHNHVDKHLAKDYCNDYNGNSFI